MDVIIPVRNRARLVQECINSVRSQTFQPATVLVVDDGSTDHTPTVLADYERSWSKLRVIQTEPRGVSAARNTALAVSKAQLVAFIDSDDLWHREKLARQVALFTADRPRLGLVHCGLRQIDGRGAPLRGARVKPLKRGLLFKDILEGFYGIAPSTIMVRRDALKMVGGFDESLVQAEDRDLCLKLARIFEFDYVHDALVDLRSHGGNSYAQTLKHDPEFVLFQRLKVWNAWFDEIADMDAVLTRFRAEALWTGISIMFRPKPDFGLYGRLARSELRLARKLFSGRSDYARSLQRFISPSPRWLGHIKHEIVARVILPNKPLLRLAQKFGRFKGIDLDTPPFCSRRF